jgi:hypothetical protein
MKTTSLYPHPLSCDHLNSPKGFYSIPQLLRLVLVFWFTVDQKKKVRFGM